MMQDPVTGEMVVKSFIDDKDLTSRTLPDPNAPPTEFADPSAAAQGREFANAALPPPGDNEATEVPGAPDEPETQTTDPAAAAMGAQFGKAITGQTDAVQAPAPAPAATATPTAGGVSPAEARVDSAIGQTVQQGANIGGMLDKISGYTQAANDLDHALANEAEATVQSPEEIAAHAAIDEAHANAINGITQQTLLRRQQIQERGQALLGKRITDYENALAQVSAMSVNPSKLWDSAGGIGQMAILLAQGAQTFFKFKGIDTGFSETWNKEVERNIAAQKDAISQGLNTANGFKSLYEMAKQDTESELEADAKMKGFMIEAAQAQYLKNMAQFKAPEAYRDRARTLAQFDKLRAQTAMEVAKHTEQSIGVGMKLVEGALARDQAAALAREKMAMKKAKGSVSGYGSGVGKVAPGAESAQDIAAKHLGVKPNQVGIITLPGRDDNGVARAIPVAVYKTGDGNTAGGIEGKVYDDMKTKTNMYEEADNVIRAVQQLSAADKEQLSGAGNIVNEKIKSDRNLRIAEVRTLLGNFRAKYQKDLTGAAAGLVEAEKIAKTMGGDGTDFLNNFTNIENQLGTLKESFRKEIMTTVRGIRDVKLVDVPGDKGSEQERLYYALRGKGQRIQDPGLDYNSRVAEAGKQAEEKQVDDVVASYNKGTGSNTTLTDTQMQDRAKDKLMAKLVKQGHRPFSPEWEKAMKDELPGMIRDEMTGDSSTTARARENSVPQIKKMWDIAKAAGRADQRTELSLAEIDKNKATFKAHTTALVKLINSQVADNGNTNALEARQNLINDLAEVTGVKFETLSAQNTPPANDRIRSRNQAKLNEMLQHYDGLYEPSETEKKAADVVGKVADTVSAVTSTIKQKNDEEAKKKSDKKAKEDAEAKRKSQAALDKALSRKKGKK